MLSLGPDEAKGKRPRIDRFVNILKPQGDERILDLACGSGRHSLELRRRAFEVIGADISAD